MKKKNNYAAHVETLAAISMNGWGVGLHSTPIGAFCRLERGILFRGGRRTGWWWRPTIASALRKLLSEATDHPRRAPLTTTSKDAEW
jgi:hypothetical protein